MWRGTRKRRREADINASEMAVIGGMSPKKGKKMWEGSGKQSVGSKRTLKQPSLFSF